MKKNRMNRMNWTAYGFMLPWLIGFLALTVGPILSSLYLSFTSYDMLTPARWIGLQNYRQMFTSDPMLLDSVKVTVRYVLWSVPLKLIFALLVAMLLNRKMRGMYFYRTVYYLPSLLGGSVAIAILWKKIFDGDGIVNQGLALFHIQGPSWISNPNYAMYTLTALSVWQFGSSMIIFLAGLKQIPAELYEASAVDGANRWTQFLRITVPMLTPVIFFNFVMQLIHSFQTFTPAFIISNGTGGPINSTLFYTLYLYMKGFSFFEMGYASAMAWVLLLVLALLTAIVFYTSKYWVHYEDGGK